MGLITNILIGITHLTFVAMDILMAMVLIKAIYCRWRMKWLEPIVNAIEPLIIQLTNMAQKISVRVTGRTYPERTLLILIVVFMCFFRILICGVF